MATSPANEAARDPRVEAAISHWGPPSTQRSWSVWPSGWQLSHENVVSEGTMVTTWVGLTEADVVLAALPIFHGFGLASLVNAPLMTGSRVVMVPVFDP